MEPSLQFFDVCIVCALPEEARAFLEVLHQHSEEILEDHVSSRHQYSYRSARLQNQQNEPLNLHISWLPRYGPQEMTLHLSHVLEECQPRIAIMTGICAGDARYTQLGDLVVAERTFTYDNGKFTLDEQGKTTHQHDTITYQPDANILQFLGLFDNWKPLVEALENPPSLSKHPQITCHLKAMASGNAVRADHPFDNIRVPVHGAIAIDMEGAAFGLVMSRHPLIRWLVVKGVCDYADQNKNDVYHDFAARASALYALSFIRAYVTHERLPPSPFSPSDQLRSLFPHSLSFAEMKRRYQAWLSTNTATFYIPGPSGLRLSTENAWAELNVYDKHNMEIPQNVEETLRYYHEWEQTVSLATEKGYRAKDIAGILYRVIIVGGPGSGKSTLCRKLAYELTNLEEIVLWIHLPSFAHRLQHGMNVTTALVDLTTNGWDAPFQEKEALFARADCLIADGLDECGTAIPAVAEALQRWATAHPFVRIVVTSRPIGYEATYFSDWEHYTLLPLTQDQMHFSSRKIIQSLRPDAIAAEAEITHFLQQLENNHIASLAARNPLLLNFLIQMSLEGKNLAKQRVGLYEQILTIWQTSLSPDRQWQVPQPNEPLAWHSLEIIGWLLLSAEDGQQAYSHVQLITQLSQRLAQEMEISQLQAGTIANNCLQFWHERGVLDRVQVGSQEIYTFVHMTFNEYTAGRYLARSHEREIQTWVKNTYHDPRWHEAFLLAVGCGAVGVVDTLLEIHSTAKQDTSALLLAVASLAESPIASHARSLSVIQPLIKCLTSVDPILVYTIVEQGKGFGNLASYLFIPLLQPFFVHQQIWTRLAAIDLALMSSPESVELETIEQILRYILQYPIDSIKPYEGEKKEKWSTREIRERLFQVNDGWRAQNDVIVRGSYVLVYRRPDNQTKELLQALYLSSAISLNTQGKLSDMLRDLGCREFVEHHQIFSEQSLRNWFRQSLSADQKMLEVILRVTNYPASQHPKRRKLIALATLIYALNVPKSGITEWNTLHQLGDIQSIETVIIGFMQLYKIDKKELALDTIWAQEKIQEELQSKKSYISLLELLPKIPMKFDIARDKSLHFPTEQLLYALKHSSGIIANGAGWLLIAGGERTEIETLLRKMSPEIESHQQMKEILIKIIPYLWENHAPEWLTNALYINDAKEKNKPEIS